MNIIRSNGPEIEARIVGAGGEFLLQEDVLGKAIGEYQPELSGIIRPTEHVSDQLQLRRDPCPSRHHTDLGGFRRGASNQFKKIA